MTDDSKTAVTRARGRTVHRYHRLYDPDALKGEISQLKPGGGLQGSIDDANDTEPWQVSDTAPLMAEDANRLKVLERIAADPRGHRRHSIVSSTAMVHRIEALAVAMPHFATAIDLVARAALVSVQTSTSLSLPLILLIGEAGLGKTYTARRLAEAIATDASTIAANLTDPFRLRGQNTGWRGARMGRIAEILLSASKAPIVIVDEFDKAVGDKTERPYDVWHSLLERENAARFKDDFLEIELDAREVIWVASANDLSAFPTSILDRLLVLEISSPDTEQLGIIIASIYAACRKSYGDTLPEHLSNDVVRVLKGHNPRRIRRLLDLAVGYAAAGNRRCLNIDDIRRADILGGTARLNRSSFRGEVGFLQTRPF